MLRRLLHLALLALTVIIASAQGASAGLVWTAVRINDTTIQLSGTGSVGGSPQTFENVQFLGIIASAGANLLTIGGNLAFTSPVQDGLFVTNELLLNATFNEADTPVGTAMVTLPAGESFAAIGASGTVIAFVAGGQFPEVGTWQMVGVPEPATLALFGVGLLGLSAARRPRRGA